MHPIKKLRWLVLPLALSLLGCTETREPTVEEAETEASNRLAQLFPHSSDSFRAVAPHLDIGGPVLVFVDIEDDLASLARLLDENLVPSMEQWSGLPPLQIEAFAKALNLTGLHAVGLSSRPVNDAFLNRSFLYLPEGQRGLFQLWGTDAPSPSLANQVPGDALFFSESRFDLSQLWPVLMNSLEALAGEEMAAMAEMSIRAELEQIPGDLDSWIAALPNYALSYFRLDPDAEPIAFEGIEIPAFQFLLRLDRIGGTLEQDIFPDLLQFGLLEHQGGEDYAIYRPTNLPPHPLLEHFDPCLIVSNRNLYLSSSEAEFLRFHRDTEEADSLARTQSYRRILRDLPTTPHAIHYLHPDSTALFRNLLHQVGDLDPQIEEGIASMESFLLRNLPDEEPFYSVRLHRSQGIEFISFANTSHKSTLTQGLVANPIFIGLMGSISIPAFERARSNSQDVQIRNNLRQISSASAQYFLETGETSVTVRDLVGPDKYIYALEPVAGESYEDLVIDAEDTYIEIILPDGRIFTQPTF